MLTQKIYEEQISRLEAAIGQQFFTGSYKVWKQELEDDGNEDKHLKKAISLMIDALTDKTLERKDIHLGAMKRFCQRARAKVYWETSMKQEAQSHNLSVDKILDQKNISPYSKSLIANLKDYLNGVVDRKTWLINQIILQNKKYGKHQGILDKERIKIG